MSIQKKHEELIESSYKELENLKSEVTQLKNIRQNIENLIGSNNELPKIFEAKFDKIVNQSKDYTDTLGVATKTYLDGNNTLLTTKLGELSSKIQEFEKEITRLVNTDFATLFKDLQEVFIDQTRKDLDVELDRFEEKSKNLQTEIDKLEKPIERLEKIDLEKHFDKLQKTLADIFGAINTINVSLTSIIPTLTTITQSLGGIQITLDAINLSLTNTTERLTIITQSLGGIQTSLDENHENVTKLLNSFSEATERHLAEQDKLAIKNAELIESKMQVLSEQNELLTKEVKTNRIIQIIGFTIIVIILVYVAVK
jgi:chromosome segregation ATPase